LQITKKKLSVTFTGNGKKAVRYKKHYRKNTNKIVCDSRF